MPELIKNCYFIRFFLFLTGVRVYFGREEADRTDWIAFVLRSRSFDSSPCNSCGSFEEREVLIFLKDAFRVSAHFGVAGAVKEVKRGDDNGFVGLPRGEWGKDSD